MKVHLHHFSKIKCPKEVTKQRNKGFSYYFFLMIKGSRSGFGFGTLFRTKRLRESVQSSVRYGEKPLPRHQGSYLEEVSLPDLIKIIRYGNHLSLVLLSHYECDEVPIF